MRHWKLIIIPLLFALFVTACSMEETTRPQTKEEYQQELQIRLDDLNQQIEALKVETQELVDEGIDTADVDQTIANLEAQAEAAGQDLEEFGADSAEAWEDFKPGLDAALEELERAFQEARTNFEDG